MPSTRHRQGGSAVKRALRAFGAVAWGAAVVGASILARGQLRKAAEPHSPVAEASAPRSRPAWIEGFSAGFEPVVQVGGEIVAPRRGRQDSSGWSAIDDVVPPADGGLDGRRIHPDL